MAKKHNDSTQDKSTAEKPEVKSEAKSALKPAKPAAHSDNDKSAPPARADDHRDGAPNDPPGSGASGEPPVG
jgi:hypothetical protein